MSLKSIENNYFSHYLETLRMGFPIIIARTSILIMVTVDAIMTGWAGPEELAYLGLGLAPVLTLMVIFIGALNATVVLASQAIGSKEQNSIGLIWHTSLLHSVIFSLIAIFLAFYVEEFFVFTGQDATISYLSSQVSLVFAYGIPGMLFFVATNLILEAIGYQKVGMYVMIFVNILNILFNGIFILEWGGLYSQGGAYEAILVSSILRWTAFIISLIYLVKISIDKDSIYRVNVNLISYGKIISLFTHDIAYKFRKIAFPMSLLQGVESVAFGVVVFIAGWFGAAALAANQATFTVMNLVYMSAIGVAGATSIRVGIAVGQKDIMGTKLSGFMGLMVGFTLTLPISIFTILYPELIAKLFFSDIQMIEITTEIIYLVGFLFVFDTMMAVSLGALIGSGDVWIPFFILAFCFWILGLPLAYIFAVHLGYGLTGLWIGIGIGIISSLLLLVPRFYIISSNPIKRI